MDRSLEERVSELLWLHRLTLGVAESCTGGLIGHRLTNVAGSSSYFMGSIVAYAYEAKEAVLGVPHDVLVHEGAVSEAVVLAMARGVRKVLNADIGLAVTGIAGPGGATPTKPVGLTYIALVAPGVERVERHVWTGNRLSNKRQSAQAVLRLLLAYLKGLKRDATS